MIDSEYLQGFISRAIAEDIGPGDHSSNCSIPEEASGKMHLLVKENGVLAGVAVAKAVFKQVEASVRFAEIIPDGSQVKKGDIAFTITGPIRAMLRGERLALNLMQRMSGIATKTHHLAQLIKGTRARLLDTRKTTPNMRPLEKEAVRLGGGYNHRMGLYDMIMLKDNHIDFAGGIPAAIEKAQAYLNENKLDLPIEVETRNLEEIEEVLRFNKMVQRVMFDNFTPELTRKAVELVGGRLETESSGGIDESSIRQYAETGVDFISVGALTHSVKSLDLSLKAV